MFWGFQLKKCWIFFLVKGMMNAEKSFFFLSNASKYIEIIQREVVLDIKRAFPYGGEIFQQDLAPCNTAKKVFEENHINILDWPGNSSDMNSIENYCENRKKGIAQPKRSS